VWVAEYNEWGRKAIIEVMSLRNSNAVVKYLDNRILAITVPPRAVPAIREQVSDLNRKLINLNEIISKPEVYLD
jgi:hypothetical protein